MVSGSCAWTSIDEAEVGGQVAADLVPGVAGVVAAHHVPVLLHEQHVGRDGCMAMRCTQWPTSAVGSGMYCELQSAVDGLPGLAAVVGAERAGGGDGDEDPRRDRLGSRRMVCRHMPPAPGCQCGPEPWPRRPESSCHVLPAVGGAEQRGVFHPGVDRVGIGQRRLQMPDPLELPGMRRAVVPLVRAGDAVVDELVAHRLPGLAAVVGALDHCPNQPLDCDAYSRFGSAGDPLRW